MKPLLNQNDSFYPLYLNYEKYLLYEGLQQIDYKVQENNPQFAAACR